MSELMFCKEHTWAKVDGTTATIGVSDYAQKELGDVVFVELPEIGDSLVKGKPFGVIESVKTVSDLYAPLSGTVCEINEELDDEPEKVNKDPQGDGWIVKIDISNSSEINDMMTEIDYKQFVEEEKK